MQDPIENIPPISSYLPDNPPTDLIQVITEEMKRRQLIWSDAHIEAARKAYQKHLLIEMMNDSQKMGLYETDYGMDIYKEQVPNKPEYDKE
jgi:hypothetical protein